MVWAQPSLWAVMQQSRLVSSAEVAAMSRSLSSTPAWFCTRMVAPLPWTTFTSKDCWASAKTSLLLSMTTTSWPSFASWTVKAEPTLPSPTMTIFMLFCTFLSHRKRYPLKVGGAAARPRLAYPTTKLGWAQVFSLRTPVPPLRTAPGLG